MILCTTLIVSSTPFDMHLHEHQIEELRASWLECINETMNPRSLIELECAKAKSFFTFEIGCLTGVWVGIMDACPENSASSSTTGKSSPSPSHGT